MELYINSVGIISGAGNNIDGNSLELLPTYDTTHLLSVEPDYKPHIPVMQLRRMSKAVRMGVVAAKAAMQRAGREQVDALSVGTAYGCLQDTERFLGKMVEQDEQMLTPTSFIQSTHNTVSGQIALLTKCNGHNLTYVHRGHSFEHAMINAQLYLNNNPDDCILVGGIDELTDNSLKALQRSEVITKNNLTPTAVEHADNNGALGGEGAVFFTVTNKPLSNKYIKVTAVDVFTTGDVDTAIKKTKQFILGSTDSVLLGQSADKKSAAYYNAVKDNLDTSSVSFFKHLCGEYPVASSFGLGMLLETVSESQKLYLINNFENYYSNWELELAV